MGGMNNLHGQPAAESSLGVKSRKSERIGTAETVFGQIIYWSGTMRF